MYGLEVCYGLDMDAEFLELANQNREKTCRYNSAVKITKCQVCDSTHDLETHHIKYQSAAKNGFVDGGQGTHHASNLTVLCSYCHDRHHAGLLKILGWVDTSTGPLLKWEAVTPPVVPQVPAVKEELTDEVKNTLRRLIVAKKREKEMVVELNKITGITITVGLLRQWKRAL